MRNFAKMSWIAILDRARPEKTFQGWHYLENSAIKLSVSTSSVDDIIFTAAKNEFKAVHLLRKLSLSDGQKPTLLDVFLAHAGGPALSLQTLNVRPGSRGENY
jgi:hypothetical protein